MLTLDLDRSHFMPSCTYFRDVFAIPSNVNSALNAVYPAASPTWKWWDLVIQARGSRPLAIAEVDHFRARGAGGEPREPRWASQCRKTRVCGGGEFGSTLKPAGDPAGPQLWARAEELQELRWSGSLSGALSVAHLWSRESDRLSSTPCWGSRTCPAPAPLFRAVAPVPATPQPEPKAERGRCPTSRPLWVNSKESTLLSEP